MSIFLPTAGPVKKYFRFSFLGICARVAWGGGSRPALQIPTLFQTNTYKANVRESPPPPLPGDFLRQNMNTINY